MTSWQRGREAINGVCLFCVCAPPPRGVMLLLLLFSKHECLSERFRCSPGQKKVHPEICVFDVISATGKTATFIS